jgi:hypothetical protein
MARRFTTEEFIKNSREVHGTKFDYSKTQYVNKKTPVIIICPIHGEYEVQPHIHVRCDCRKCFYENKAKNTVFTTEDFVSKAISIHKDKYDYSETKYVNKRTKVSILCKVHGIFEQLPSNHLSSGCGRCSRTAAGGRRLGKKNSRRVTNTEEFIREAKLIHGDDFDYTNTVYKSAKDSVFIKCHEHGTFSQTAHNHLTGFKCNQCATQNNSKLFSLGTGTFVVKAKEIHGAKYNYSLVNYKNANEKVTVICPDHGKFEIHANNHLKGISCKRCSDERKTLTQKEFISNSVAIHGERYDYSFVDYINNDTLVKIGCQDHGVFEQKPRNHASSAAHGCAICNKMSFWDLSRLSPEQLSEMNGMYILIMEENITGNQIVKVGISKNVKRRCKEIEWSSNNFYTVKLLAYHPKILSEAIQTEVNTHQRLAIFNERPTVRFQGETECFTIDSLPILVDLGLLDIEQLERLNEGYELLDAYPKT